MSVIGPGYACLTMTAVAARYEFNGASRTLALVLGYTPSDTRDEFDRTSTTNAAANRLLRFATFARRHSLQHAFRIEECFFSIASMTAGRHGQPERRSDQLAVPHGNSGFTPDTRQTSPEEAPTAGNDARPSGQPKDVCAAKTTQCAVDHLATRPLGRKDRQGQIRLEISE
jgi:hypothetical protein